MPQPVRNGSTGATSAAGIGWAIQKKKVAQAMTNSALGQCPWCRTRCPCYKRHVHPHRYRWPRRQSVGIWLKSWPRWLQPA